MIRGIAITAVVVLLAGVHAARAQSSLAGRWAAEGFNQLADIGCSPIGPQGVIAYDGKVLSLVTTTQGFEGTKALPPRTVERRYALDASGGAYTLEGVVHRYVVRSIAGSLVVEDTIAPSSPEGTNSTTLTVLALNNRDELELVHVVPLEWAPGRTATCRVIYKKQG